MSCKLVHNTYDVFGTSTALKELTASYVADSKAVAFFRYMESITLEVSFTTGSATGEFVDIQILLSNDPIESTPTNFFVWTPAIQADASPATEWDASAVGVRMPKDVASPAATTNYKRSVTLNPEAANWIKVMVKSSAAGNFGSAWVRATVTGR